MMCLEWECSLTVWCCRKHATNCSFSFIVMQHQIICNLEQNVQIPHFHTRCLSPINNVAAEARINRTWSMQLNHSWINLAYVWCSTDSTLISVQTSSYPTCLLMGLLQCPSRNEPGVHGPPPRPIAHPPIIRSPSTETITQLSQWGSDWSSTAERLVSALCHWQTALHAGVKKCFCSVKFNKFLQGTRSSPLKSLVKISPVVFT